MTTASYTPRSETVAMLDRAWDIVQSVPYSVSARWLFYRLLQEGYYSDKGDYKNKFVKTISTARHAFYKGWRPDTLTDETREVITRGHGASSVDQWLGWVSDGLTCRLNKWDTQPYYVEIWYEARAMTQQFEYYTNHVTLRPMGGQPSIPYKWQAAKELEQIQGKPIIILYFGDLDPAGETIGEVIKRDVGEWCSKDFTFIRCGLNTEQVSRYKVPENFEKPGQYQWEALSDEAAREIITESMKPYLRPDAFVKIEAIEADATTWIRAELISLQQRWNGGDE